MFSKDVCFLTCFKYMWNFRCTFPLLCPAAGVFSRLKCRKPHTKAAKLCLLVQRHHQPQATEILSTWKSRNGLSDISGFFKGCFMVLKNSSKAFHMPKACGQYFQLNVLINKRGPIKDNKKRLGWLLLKEAIKQYTTLKKKNHKSADLELC